VDKEKSSGHIKAFGVQGLYYYYPIPLQGDRGIVKVVVKPTGPRMLDIQKLFKGSVTTRRFDFIRSAFPPKEGPFSNFSSLFHSMFASSKPTQLKNLKN